MARVSVARIEAAIQKAEALGDTANANQLRAALARSAPPAPTIPTQPTGPSDLDRRRAELEARIAAREAAPVAPTETGFFEDITSGFGAGVVGVGEMAALGLAAPLEEENELAARERIQSVAESFRPEGGDPDSVTYKLSSALGSIAGLAAVPAAAAFTPVGTVGALGLGALAAGAAGAGEASERARAADATEEERGSATLRGTAIGLLDVLPIARVLPLSKMPELAKLADKIPPEKVETIGERIYSAGITGGAEAAQEAASNVLQNLNEQEYNAAAETFGGTAEEAALGGGAGAILQGLVDLFAPRRGAKTVGDTVAPEEAPPRLEEDQVQGELFARPTQTVEPDTGGALTDFNVDQINSAVERLTARGVAPNTITEEAVFDEILAAEERADAAAPEQLTIEGAIDAAETAEVQAMIDADETAEIEAMVAEDDAAKAAADVERAQARKRSERETAIGQQVDEELDATETRRREILADVVEKQPTRQLGTLRTRFSRALEEVNLDPEPTAAENASMERVIDISRAEPVPQDDLPSDSDVAAIEARIREAREDEGITDTSELRQESFAGLGRREAPTEQEATPEPRIITEEDLTTAGFKSNAAVRKRVTGKDLNDPEVRADLVKAGQRFKSQEVKTGVDRLLQGVPSEQRDLFADTKREPVAAGSGTGDAVDLQSVEVPTGRANTVESGPSVGGAVADAGGGTGRSVAGEGREQTTLTPTREVKPEIADAGRVLAAARRAMAEAEEAVAAKPTQKNQRALKQAERRFAQAVGLLNQRLADVDTQAIPEETVELQRRAGQQMSATGIRPAMAAAAPTTVEEVTAKEPTVEEARTTEQQAADKQSLLAERRKARDELMAADPDLSKAEAMRIASGQVLYAPPREYLEALDAPLPDVAAKAVLNNELRRALLDIADKSGDKFVSRVAKRLSEFTGDTRILAVPASQLGKVDGQQVDGRFITADNTIVLNRNFSNTQVLLHEMAHAATINVLRNPSHPTTKKLTKLYESSKEYLDQEYGSTNVAEFVAEAFTNPEFQSQLARINPDGKPLSIWQEIIRTVSNLLGLGKERGTAQREAQRLIEDILAPAAKHRGAPALNSLSTRDGVPKVIDTIATPKGTVADSVKKVTDEFRALTGVGTKGGGPLKKALLSLMPNQAAQDIIEDAGVVGSDKVFTAIELQRGDLNRNEASVRAVLQPIREWGAKQSKETMDAWNNLIYDSTVDQVDPELTLQEAKDRYKQQTIELEDDAGNITTQLKIDRYKELRAIYDSKTVGADGRRAYSNLRKLYKDQYTQMTAALEGRIDGLPIEEQAKANLKQGIYNKMLENTKLEPYFPLTRTGSYFLDVRDPDEGINSAVFAFESGGARLRAMEEYAKQGYKVDAFDASDTASYKEAPSGSFVSSVLGLTNAAKTGLPADQKQQFEAVEEQIVRLFVEHLPESSFARSLLGRKGTQGYDVDAIDAARTKAFDLGRQVARIKNSRLIDQATQEVIEANPEMRGSVELEEIQNRAKFAASPPLDNYAKNANRFAFLYTIGFNASSALVNLSQIPLFAYPMLAGRYGFNATKTALGGSTKLFMGSPKNRTSESLFGDEQTPRSVKDALMKGDLNAARAALADSAMPSIENYYTITRDAEGRPTYTVRKDLDLDSDRVTELEEMIPLVTLAERRGQLNSSFIADTLSTSEAGRKMSFMDKVTNASAFMFHEAEVMNRQVTMMAAYKLALKKLVGSKKPTAEQQQQAAEQAIYETQQINGGATLETGPRLARKGIGRVALMYKTYGIQMYYTMLKSARQLAKNIAPGDDAQSRALRAEAFKQLAGVHLSALFFAGAQGLPLYGAVAMLHDLLKEDYEEDADTALRGYLDNDALFKGALSEITGLDVSQRVKLTDLLFEADRFNSDPSPEEEFAHLFGGPAWSVYSRGRKGVDKIADGELLAGIEDMMPGAVRNLYRAVYKYPHDEGILTRRGDPVYDDITNGDLFSQLLGFPPTEYTRAMEETSAAKRLDVAAQTARRKILKRYYVALRFGDNDGALEALDDMMEFNQSEAVQLNPAAFISSDTIERSLNRHMATTAKMHNGVLLSPYVKTAADQEGYL
jgi:hypothetical protein